VEHGELVFLVEAQNIRHTQPLVLCELIFVQVKLLLYFLIVAEVHVELSVVGWEVTHRAGYPEEAEELVDLRIDPRPLTEMNEVGPIVLHVLLTKFGELGFLLMLVELALTVSC